MLIRRAILIILIGYSIFGTTPRTHAAILTAPREVITAANAHRLQPLLKLGYGVIRHLDWSPDGTRLFVSTRSGVYIYNPTDLKQEPRLLDPNGSQRVVFNSAKTKLATFAQYGAISVWDVKTLKLLGTFSLPGQDPILENGLITAVWFDSADFPIVASSGNVQNEDKTYQIVLRVYSTRTKSNLLYLQNLGYYARTVGISPDTNLLAIGLGQIGDTRPTQLWDLRTGKQIGELPPENAVINEIAFSDLGDMIATANGDIETDYGNSGQDDDIVLWDAATQRRLLVLNGHSDWVRQVAFRPSGYFVASGSADGTVRLWNTRTGEQSALFDAKDAGVEALAFDPTGDKLAVATDGGYLSLWQVSSGKLIERIIGFNGERYLFVGPGNPERGCCLTFSHDSQHVAYGQLNGIVHSWNTLTGKSEATLYGHTWAISGLAYVSHGQTLISASWDETIRYWNLASNRVIYQKKLDDEFLYSFTLSNNENYLLTKRAGKLYNDYSRVLYSVSKHESIWENTKFVPWYANGTVRTASAISPDSKYILYSVDNEIYRYEIGMKEPSLFISFDCGSKNCQDLYIDKLQFLLDGKRLAAALSDGSVRILDFEQRKITSSLVPPNGGLFTAIDPMFTLAAPQKSSGIVILNTDTGQILQNLNVTDPYLVTFNSDGTLLAAVGDYAMLYFWDVKTGIEPVKFADRSNDWGDYRISEMAYSPDGTLLAVADNEDVVTLYGVLQE